MYNIKTKWTDYINNKPIGEIIKDIFSLDDLNIINETINIIKSWYNHPINISTISWCEVISLDDLYKIKRVLARMPFRKKQLIKKTKEFVKIPSHKTQLIKKIWKLEKILIDYALKYEKY